MCRVVVVGRDRDDLGVGDGDLRIVRSELQVLLVLLRAVVAPRQCEDQRVVALELAELAYRVGVIRQGVVGEDSAGSDVGSHGSPPLSPPEGATLALESDPSCPTTGGLCSQHYPSRAPCHLRIAGVAVNAGGDTHRIRGSSIGRGAPPGQPGEAPSTAPGHKWRAPDASPELQIPIPLMHGRRSSHEHDPNSRLCAPFGSAQRCAR